MVSVITITYNRKDFLTKTIQSVLNQSYQDFEYLIVDDGSTDNSDVLVAGFNDDRLKYIYKDHSGFISRLKNIALDQAKGEIVAFLDSDDLWDSRYLEKVVSVFDDDRVCSLVSNAFISKGGSQTPHFKNEGSFLLYGSLLKQKLLNDNFIIYTSCFSLRWGSVELRYNENLAVGDNDFFLKILSVGNAAVLLDKLVVITKHESNMSAPGTLDSPFIEGFYEALETLMFLRKERKISGLVYRKVSSLYLYKLANSLIQINHKREAKKKYGLAFLIFPLNFKALIKYFYFVNR